MAARVQLKQSMVVNPQGAWLGESEDCWVSGIVSCCCEKLVAEAGTVREPRGRGTSAFESRYQATASKDVNTPVCVCSSEL
jgi:hypothetical protein